MENTEYSNKIFLDGKTKNLRINVKKNNKNESRNKVISWRNNIQNKRDFK